MEHTTNKYKSVQEIFLHELAVRFEKCTKEKEKQTKQVYSI